MTSTTVEGAPAAIAEGGDDDDKDGGNKDGNDGNDNGDGGGENKDGDEQDPKEEEPAPPTPTTYNVGNFVVTTLGEQGTDWDYSTATVYIAGWGNAEGAADSIYSLPASDSIEAYTYTALIVKSSAQITVSTNGTSTAGIYINPGVHANITFAGVTIKCELPVNIVTNKTTVPTSGTVANNATALKSTNLNPDATSLNLILADGTTNTLIAAKGNISKYYFPALRCGEGSYLTIDDARVNVDTNGEFVAPNQGRISRTCTLTDGTEVHAGDRLTLLDSTNPGKLICYGGYRASAIGGAAIENSGNMTFNGGDLTVRAFGTALSDEHYGAGAGIGGGHAGGGTTMTFNGGSIDSVGSYHGAGIGGGCTYTGGMSRTVTYALTDAVLCRTPLHTIAGDININGGYLVSQGCTHSNAFGQACGGTNNGKTIKITGGTLLPTSVSDWYDIGGSGGEVIITGGSVRLTGLSASKFQSSDGCAYADEDHKIPVMPTKISLEGYKNLDGEQIYKDAYVDNMNIKIAGVPDDYGMPSKTDSECALYFWLPKKTTTTNKEVEVNVQIISNDGSTQELQPFFIPDVETASKNASTGVFLKQYITFKLNAEQLSKLYEAYDSDTAKSKGQESPLKKRYDGNTLDGSAITSTIVEGGGIPLDNPANKYLDNANYITFDSQRETYNSDDDTYTIDSTASKDSGICANVGLYQLTVTSTQYANDATFSKSFWGHRATIDGAEITPAESRTKLLVSRPKRVQTVSSADGSLSVQSISTLSTDSFHLMLLDAETAQETTTTIDTTTYADNTITLTAYVAPSNGDNNTYEEALTCGSPTGYVNFYVHSGVDDTEGTLLGSVDLTPAVNGSGANLKDSSGYNYSIATYNWTPSTQHDNINPASEYTFTAEYVGIDQGQIVNYNSSSAAGISAEDANAENAEPTALKIETVEQPVDETDDNPTGGTGITITYKPAPPADDGQDTTGEGGSGSGTGPVTPSTPEGGEESTESDTSDAAKKQVEKTVEASEECLCHQLGIEQFTVEDSGFKLDASGGQANTGLTYTSLNPSVATIDENGVVTIVGGGTARILITNASDGFYKAVQREVIIHVLSTSPAGQQAVITKAAANVTDPTGPTQVNDWITYTLQVKNQRWGSVWNGVHITDPLPAGLELDVSSMQLTRPGATEPEAVPASCYNADTHTIDVEIGTVNGGEAYTLTFSVRVSEAAAEPGTAADIGNEATATGTGVNGEDIEATSGRVYPDSGSTVYYADPRGGLTKQATNNTDPGAQTQAGDRITYTINVQNRASGSLWRDVVVRDPVPAGLNVDGNSLYLTRPDGSVVHVSSAAYNPSSRLISVYVGNVYGGETYTLSFDVIVGDDAVGTDIGNTAQAWGGSPTGGTWWGGNGEGVTGGSGGGSGSSAGGGGAGGGNGGSGGGAGDGSGGGSGGYSCGDPFWPDDASDTFDEIDGGVIESEPIDPVYPSPLDDPHDGGGVVESDPEPELTKTVTDETHIDGETFTEDVLEYDITLTNPKAGSVWRNVMLFDYLPPELVLDKNSLVLVYPNGSTRKVAASEVWHPASRTILMTIGTLNGGETYSLRYKAQIEVDEPSATQEAIVNTVEATGENPDGTQVSAGNGPEAQASVAYPADARARALELARQRALLDPYAGGLGGFAAWRGKLAQTGDAAGATAVCLAAVGVLAAAAAGAAARKRNRRR
jgi:fimbrial isopeptide formation D2 family protein